MTRFLRYTFCALLCTQVGAQPLPNGWKLHPAGTEVAVDAFPMAGVVTPDDKYLLVLNAGAHPPSIGVIDLASSKETSRTPVPDAWLGMTMTKAGDKVYVGGGSRAAVFEFSFSNGVLTAGRTFPLVAEKDRTSQDFAGDVKLAPDGHLLYVANVFRDTVVVMNPQSGLVLSRIKTGRRPYRILFHPSGKTLYVSSWADGAIGQYDVNSGERLVNVRVAPHPTDMLWVDGSVPGDTRTDVKARVFVPAANTNSLFVFGASESGELTKLDSINLALTPRQPLGMTPSAVGLSSDKKLVYVACADVNALAVIDIATDRSLISSPVKGFVPTGAYPTVITGLPDGKIAVLNGHSNTVQVFDTPDDTKLGTYTGEVMASIPYRDENLDNTAAPEGNSVRANGPIKHVVYVIREGSAAAGKAPNFDKLSAQFPVLTFPALGEAAEWLTAAIAPDYSVRLGDRFGNNNTPPDPASVPPAGYLWDAAAQAGVKLRNYGFEVHNLAKPTADGGQVDRVYDPALTASTDMEYRGPDPAYPDTDRAKEFASELAEYSQTGELPQLLLVRIGTDDQALGTITDAIRKSRFWNETAVLVADGDRALIMSPWARPSLANSTAYDQVSLLRSAEIILGLRPMTVFDAAATPVYGAFSGAPAGAQ